MFQEIPLNTSGQRLAFEEDNPMIGGTRSDRNLVIWTTNSLVITKPNQNLIEKLIFFQA